MRKSALILALTVAPALAAAQTQANARAETRANAELTVERGPGSRVPDGFSTATRARLEAMVEVARKRNLPTEPMTDRMAEGQAKGASEAQIVSASSLALTQLDASQQVLIRAGRDNPSSAEVTQGAQVIAQGATSAQLEALIRQAPSDRRLEVAFAVVSQLSARGLPVDQAMTVIGASLSSGASDGRIVSAMGTLSGQAGLRLGGTPKP